MLTSACRLALVCSRLPLGGLALALALRSSCWAELLSEELTAPSHELLLAGAMFVHLFWLAPSVADDPVHEALPHISVTWHPFG